jgi:hypothetical protein
VERVRPLEAKPCIDWRPLGGLAEAVPFEDDP